MSELAAPSHTPRPSSPKPQKSLNRQVVLEEDEYTAALSQIIARDFFPSLVHLDATNNYLDALRSEDPQLINASVRQLQDLATPLTGQYRPQQTPSQTPYAGGPTDTPLRTPSTSSARPTKRARYDTDMSLDAFQARYTSEDNSSFTQILDDENRKRAEKWGWAWEAQRRVEAQRDKMIEARDRLLIEPHSIPGVKEKLVIEPPTAPAGLITASGEKQDEVEVADGITVGEDEQSALEVAVVPAGEEAEPVDVMARRKDTRVAGVDGWKFKVRLTAVYFGVYFSLTPCRRAMPSCSHRMLMLRRMRHLQRPLQLLREANRRQLNTLTHVFPSKMRHQACEAHQSLRVRRAAGLMLLSPAHLVSVLYMQVVLLQYLMICARPTSFPHN